MLNTLDIFNFFNYVATVKGGDTFSVFAVSRSQREVNQVQTGFPRIFKISHKLIVLKQRSLQK